MSEQPSKIKLFESHQVRAEWDEAAEKWWFSVVDIVAVLTEQKAALTARRSCVAATVTAAPSPD